MPRNSNTTLVSINPEFVKKGDCIADDSNTTLVSINHSRFA